MFLQIFLFELRYRLKRPATYLYFLIYLLYGFLAISTGSTPASEKVFHNAPWTMAGGNITFSMIMMLVCSAIMGVPLYRDIEHNTRQYFFSYPITKAGYFWGRFWGSFVFVLFIGTGFNWGSIAGSVVGPAFGWVPAERIGSYGLWNYFQPFFFYGITNLLLASSIFFALVAVSRNVKVIYTTSIFLLIGYALASFLTSDLEKRELVKLLDPFMVNTFDLETRYYTPAEKNTLLLAPTRTILLNRFLWLSVAAVITAIAYFRFSFQRFLAPVSLDISKETSGDAVTTSTALIPKVTQVFNTYQRRQITWQLSKIEFLNIVKDNYFRAILLGGIVFLLIDYWIGNTNYGVPDRPLTIFLMDYKSFNYIVFNFIILLFYTGEAVHRERTTGFHIISDALPVPTAVSFISKLLGLIGVALLLVSIPMVAGVLVQTIRGHYVYQFDVYFRELYLITFSSFVLMILLSFAVHLVVRNKFAGHGIALMIWLALFLLRNIGEMDYNLFFYFYTPNYRWSDINGLGHFAAPLFWFTLYWTFFGAMLLCVAYLFFERGITGGFRERWRVARSRLRGWPVLLLVLTGAGWLATGAWNYYNVSVLNTYTSRARDRFAAARYEQALKKYMQLPQPKVTALKAMVDIYPEERMVKVHGILTIVNKTPVPVPALHLSADQSLQYSIRYNGEALPYQSPLYYRHSSFNFLKTGQDTVNYRIYQLPQPLQPGDTARLEVFTVTAYRGFVNSGLQRDILYDGTFFSGGLPSFGYQTDRELESDEQRKKKKLPPKSDQLPPQWDSAGRHTFLFNDDADLIDFEVILSTSAGQTAIAPGYLQRQWTENGRDFFHYRQDGKIGFFTTVVSGNYELFRDSVTIPGGQKTAIEIYHFKHHKFNLQRFNAALKDGLAYFSEAYGPYQHRQIRIIEFPRYASFAQSFPNTVPYSEAFGWVADFSDPNKFDYTYWVTAHELAHQWWGHQVSPNKTRGSNLISEALAEYTALLLAERRYGRDNMKRFLKEELDGYLRGRAGESKKENTFINCNRPYQWYQKGSLILYGLRDFIGEKNLNTAIRAFRDTFAFREHPPFAGSDDLYRFINRYTPDSLRYYLVDTWEKITLYDNRFISAVSKDAGNGFYDVTLRFSTRKMYADSTGKETAAPMNDYIDVGVFAADTKDKNGRTQTQPLYLKKHKLQPGEHSVQIRVKGKPVRAGIDPYNKLIDRIPDDNTGSLE